MRKVVIIVGVVVGLGLIGIASNTSNTTNGQKPAAAAAPKPKINLAGAYDQIQNGQSKAQVTQLIGKSADNCTETQTQGFGTYEACSWFGSFGDGANISISFKDGAVDMKTKSGF